MEIWKYVFEIKEDLDAVIHVYKSLIGKEIFFYYKIGVVHSEKQVMRTEEVLKSPYYPDIESVVEECFTRIDKILDANSKK
jgi:hypothetical protein